MKDRIYESLSKINLSQIRMPIITLYNSPVDYPGKLVCRVFDISIPTDAVVIYESVEEARRDARSIGFVMVFPRDKNDNMHIVETYMR